MALLAPICECGHCPTCYRRAWKRRNPEKVRAADRHWRLANPERRREILRNAAARRRDEGREYQPETRRAYAAVARALKAGRLERPSACERCEQVPPPAYDGRSQIQAHHDDYAKPLEVEWLCVTCHGLKRRVTA